MQPNSGRTDVVGVIAADTLVADDRVLSPGWLEVDTGRVVQVGSGDPPRPPADHLAGCVVAPGFVDMHVHGGGGATYTSADLSDAVLAAHFHRENGTTSTLASLVTASPTALLRSVTALSELVNDGLIEGIHLEGPWLSAQRKGAHERSQLRNPDPAEIDALFRAAGGTIRMVTLAPELDGGLEAIRRIVDAGAVAAVGHTDATYDVTCEAIRAGARVGTHLFNAMRPVHHREPGPVIALLENPDVIVELVADGVHVHPALVRHVATIAGPARIALVTDAMAAAGMPDGHYQLGALDVEVKERIARLPNSGPIAGGTATMEQLFRNLVSYRALPRAEGLRQAAQMTATTPARALGLEDVGSLRPGQRADLVVLDSELRLRGVMTRGRWQGDPPPRAMMGSCATSAFETT